jgi:hypothetical protein
MPQASRRARFALEALDEFFVPHELGCDQLQRYITFGPEVRREIDGAHAALAEQSLKSIFRVKHLADVLFEIVHAT